MSASVVGTRSALVVLALFGAELVAPTAAHATTTVFTSTGVEQTFTVPSDVRGIRVVAIGAPGGPASSASQANLGGVGGRAIADIAVHPGETLYVEVGGVGRAAEGPGSLAGLGGFNGGGNGGSSDDVYGGGGGGASDVRTVAASGGGGSLTSRLIVAAGGGGGAFEAESGGPAGQPGDPTCSGCAGGAAAASNHGGGGGSGTLAGDSGALGIGGQGGDGSVPSSDGGGGGGAGLYGGGGGGANNDGAGGGGGGSSGFGSGATGTSLHADSTGVPSVTFTYVKTMPTKTSVAAKHHRRSLSVDGTVKPATPGVKVAVTLLRKHRSKYKKVATKHPVLTTAGHFTTSFTRPKSGKCEVTAVFAGYRNYTASHQTKKFAC